MSSNTRISELAPPVALPQDYVPLKDRGALPTPLAAVYIGEAEGTLKNKRSAGVTDPPYVRTGRSIVYRVADLDDYLKRHQLGLTQAEVAQRAGVGRRFVVDLERGHPRAEFAKVLAVLDAVGVEPPAVPVVDPGPAVHK